MASITINTNLSSMICQKYLSSATSGMNKAMERLATGYKINTAKDDAAGYAVSTAMNAKINGYDIINTNAQMGLDMLTTQQGVLDIINDYLQRVRDLTMQAANGTYSSNSRDAIATEVIQRMGEINRLCESTDFNEMYMLDGSRTEGVNLQVGLYSTISKCVIQLDAFLFDRAMTTSIMGFASVKNQDGTDNPKGYLDLRVSDSKTEEFCYGVRVLDDKYQPTYDDKGNIIYKDDEFYASALAAALAENGTIEKGTSSSVLASGKQFTIKTMCDAIYRNDSSAREFITIVDNAINNVSLRCTQIGAYQNRLESTVDATNVQAENLTQAVSTLKDTDVGVESSSYIKYQILQQSAATLLATANQIPSIALNLI